MNEPIMPQIENWRVISYYQDWILFVTCGETPAGKKFNVFILLSIRKTKFYFFNQNLKVSMVAHLLLHVRHEELTIYPKTLKMTSLVQHPNLDLIIMRCVFLIRLNVQINFHLIQLNII